MKTTWFEVYTSDDEEGTETIASFDTFEEAEAFILEHSEMVLSIDEWQIGEDGTNERVI